MTINSNPLSPGRRRAIARAKVLGPGFLACLVLFFFRAAIVLELPAALSLPAGFTDSTVGSGWNEAVGITFAADGRMFVWERAGRVWVVEDGVRSGTPFIDLSPEVGGWRDFGLLGFCLHPDFYSNGHVYLFYVVDHHHAKYFGTPAYSASTDEYYQATIGRITRYTARAADGFRSVDPASRTVLFGESLSTGNAVLHESHGVGTILFGADGTLLASCGDGASYSSTDLGSASETYYAQGLSEGIIRANENVGAYRAQMVNSFNGKILRLDPDTGDGLSGNPFYDPAAPRAPKSRVWALGFRNPCRMTLRPGTGSRDRADANPGSLYVGDVGWRTWEELSVCTEGGQNFGWPAFEGLEATPFYNNSNLPNRDAPNPLYGINGCLQQFFYFRDLIRQDTLGTPSWPNQCDASQQVPATIPHFLNHRPALDWKHDTGPARTGIYSGNNAAVINVGAAGSPVSGSTFAGNCSIGGVWYTNTAFPELYRNTYFHADYGEGWIKSFVFDAQDRPVAVRDFLGGGGGIVFVTVDPRTGDLLYISWTTSIHRVRYSSGNQPPTAVAAADRYYGPAPLVVQFTGTNSADPEGQPLAYRWDFGDGTPASTAANPTHTFNAPANVPTPYTVTLVVTDNGGLKSTNRLAVSVNNTPPEVIITSPVDGTRYPLDGDTVYACTALVTDTEHPNSQLACSWQTFLHHNDHEHNEPPDNNCATSTTISGVGCNGETFYYRVVLTVSDPAGLSTTAEARLHPDCARQVPVITWKINFQPAAAPVPAGYLPDSGAAFGDRGNGFTYGWDRDNSANLTDRNSPNSPDQRYDTFAATQVASGGSIWEIALPAGAYSVLLVAGDATRFNGTTYRFEVEGVPGLSGTPTAQSRWVSGSNTVTVTDGRLTVSNGSGASNNKLCFAEITPVEARLRWVGRDAAGVITLGLEGSGGRNFEVQGSSDFLNWRPIDFTQNADGTISFLDGEAGLQRQRFYRVKSK